MRSLMVATLLLALSFASRAQPLNSLQAVMDAAATQPAAQAAAFRSQAARAGARATWRGTWLPSLQVDGLAARVDNVSTVPTPVGSFELGDEDLTELTVSLRQPLLDLSAQRYGVRAARLDAEAAELVAQRRARESGAAAGVQYLSLLALDAELHAIAAQSKSLAKRVERVRAQADAGRALAADVLDIELAQARIAQQTVRLRARRQTVLQDLRRRTGSEPVPNRPSSPPGKLPLVSAEQAEAQRADLLALARTTQAADNKQAQSRAGALPTLGASLSYLRSDGSPIMPEEDTRIGVSLNWEPFSSGRRAAQASAAAYQRDAADADYREARAGLRVQLAQAEGDFQSAVALATLAQSALASAKSTLQTRGARFEAGRATIDDVLDAEARLAEQTALAASAEYQQWQALINYRLAAGLPLQLGAESDVP